jgi:hypothetical protein
VAVVAAIGHLGLTIGTYVAINLIAIAWVVTHKERMTHT